MFELGIILGITSIVITIIGYIRSATNEGVLHWDKIKGIALSLTLTLVFLIIPFMMEPKVELNKQYVSNKIYYSNTHPDVEFSQPIYIFEFKIDRPFTWLGDGKSYKILIPESKPGRNG